MIPGGYILKARKTLESDLMDKPPLWSKLWDWMLLRAEWREGGKLLRGSFLTSIDEMREAMSWLVGYRRVTPTRDEIRSAYEGFAKATMATTAKTTRGMIVSIINYGLYQNPKNYEAHNEDHGEGDTKPPVSPQDSKEGLRIKNESYTGTPGDGTPGHEGDAGEGKPSAEPTPPPQAAPKGSTKDPRPAGCPPEQWTRYLAFSQGFHRQKAQQLGNAAPYSAAKVLGGAKALDSLIRTKHYPEHEVLAVIGWSTEDVFWKNQLRSLGALLTKSRNGELKYGNILVSMTSDLERKRAQEAARG